ncbi:MAG: putative porin [Gammaproteobacteria bacterium]
MNRFIALTGLTLLMATPVVNAEVSDAEFEALKDQLNEALGRIDELEGKAAETEAAVQKNTATVEENSAGVEEIQSVSGSSWADRIKIVGDFRYRYQNEDRSDRDKDRNRQRIRARPAIIAQVTDSTEVGFGLTTGGEDPVSANQTLGGGGSSKDINLDLAYVTWVPEYGAGAFLTAGKFANPLVAPAKSGLMWDSDWRPEGFNLGWKNDMFFAQYFGTWLESDDSGGGGSEYSWGVNGGIDSAFGPLRVKAGASYYEFNLAGESCAVSSDNEDFDCFDNTFSEVITTIPNPVPPPATIDLVTDKLFVYDYELINAFAEVGFDVGSLPLSVWADWVQNQDAPSGKDTGYQAGAQIGKAKKRGTWQFKAYYEDLESDAVVGQLTNSDFGGGGTDGKGYFVSAKYATSDYTNIAIGYYDVEKQDTENNGLNPFDWKTLQLDFNFKYK